MASIVIRAALLALAVVRCQEELERPIAIIPWSQYQQRLRAQKAQNAHESENRKLSASNYHPDRKAQLQQELETSYRGDFNQLSRPRASVIRPQIRRKVAVTQPSDYMALAAQAPTRIMKSHEELPQSRSMFVVGQNHIQYPPAPNLEARRPSHVGSVPKAAAAPSASIPQTVLRAAGGLPGVQITNGVPFHAANWEDGVPHYLTERTDRRPAQHAASNVQVVDPSIALNSLPEIDNAAISPNNIVNSIFAQSNAQGIQAIPQQAIQTQPNAVEQFLANSGNLETISKLAKNLLNVGGESGQQGLLEMMTNALRNRGIPLGSAIHDEAPPTVDATAPKRSLMEHLINQAAAAINTSLKEKEKAEKLELEKAKEAGTPATPAPPTTPSPAEDKRISELLEKAPQDQRDLLKAAVMAKEISPESLAAAVESLVRDDTVEESRKEKGSRLIEWIKANRPASATTTAIPVAADKLPYYGRYCGSFVQQAGVTKQFNPSGAIWIADEKRLIVSKFFFQPGSLLSENVTFWLGPANSSGNAFTDTIPSENGFYVKPVPIDVSVFTLRQLPEMKATVRKGLNAKVFVNGTSPIEPVVESKDKTKRRKREENSVIAPTYVPAKPAVQLLVKGGVVHVVGDNSTELLPLDSLPPIARLKQPEEDQIDNTVIQPLEWYAGFQPLLLTLPSNRTTADIRWVTLRDHKRKELIASVLIPNGPLFQAPAPAILRPLSANGPFTVSSGKIIIHDMKSIEIQNLTLKTEGAAVWFMFGKDVLPNPTGKIIPRVNSVLDEPDCTSLRDYFGETVHLRLPGHLDVRDMFWLSIFSPEKSVSYSHMYVPFNNLHVPPDLSGKPTVTCRYE